MLQPDPTLTADSLLQGIGDLFSTAASKIRHITSSTTLQGKTPVFTIDGKYVPQGWTEWTQGFQYGAAILTFDAINDQELLEIGRQAVLAEMPPHVTHFGVHDHGFNNVSTYAALRRLMTEGRLPHDEYERHFYELALMASGAVQANRWSETADGEGFIYSFNGPHSLFCDTIRSLRSLAMAHLLGHSILDENDHPISLLGRLIEHASTTTEYNVYFGEGRDIYDVRGRVAHESIFNMNDGCYRCPSSQQGYSPFTTWTRGLAWIMLGYPEQLEYLETVSDQELELYGGRVSIEESMTETAKACCDYYVQQTTTDGIPFWDTGAPGLQQLGTDYLDRPSDPFNDCEPVDSSAAAIAAQGLLRLGHYLKKQGDDSADHYWQAGLTTMQTLLQEPYVCHDLDHEGLLLHTVYHRPRGWDHIPAGRSIPCGESCMWGDYHLLEAALYVKRFVDTKPYYTFWGE